MPRSFGSIRDYPSRTEIALLSVIVAASFLCSSCRDQSGPSDVASTPGTNTAQPAVGAPRAEFQKLAGKWQRPDGGYVLHLKSVDAKGTFDAAYFNPDPINVSKAVAIQDGAVTKVFVELRDVNYPGCTYSLTYDPQADHLYGQYFQAAAQQTYDITFARLKE